MALRQRLVAIRYIQVRSDDRPQKPPIALQAAIIVSWRTSSASASEPSIR